MADGPARAGRRDSLSLALHASTAFRLVVPGTSGASAAVAVAPRVQVQPLGPRLLGGEVLPRPDAPVEVWRRERGRWRVVAHPILDAHGKFRTPLPLRPVDYRITVAADGRLAAAQTSLHVTRRLLSACTRDRTPPGARARGPLTAAVPVEDPRADVDRERDRR